MEPEFKENLFGRLGNFPLSVERPLFPIFEAISNSIHAIEDSKRADGQIVVHIHRNPAPSAPLIKDAKPTETVCAFTIEDNGIGFTDKNFSSFCTADSTFKKARGGKGVGRLSWLKVFQKAEVVSVFEDKGKRKRRSFSFVLEEKPIEHHEIADADTATPLGTSVHLSGFRPEYQKHCPKAA